MLAELFSIVAPVYICAGLGFVWARSGRRYDTSLVTDLIMRVGAPSLVFSSLVGLEVAPGAMAELLLATLLALGTLALLGAGILRVAGLPATSFLAPLVFMNSGNMGLPLCLFAFGEEGLALGSVFFATCALGQFTVGQWLWSGRISAGDLFSQPLVWFSLAAVAVLALGLPVPDWILKTTRVLGGFTIPLMQITLGVSLATFGIGPLGRGFALAALRLGLGFGVGLAIAALLGLEGVARGVFVLDCAMPVAVFNYMLAERHGRSPGDVAGLVVLSTLISFATVPLLLAWLL